MLIQRGVLYVATGAEFAAAAAASARSVRATNPGLPIALFGDFAALSSPAISNTFDLTLPIARPHRRSKVDCLCESPFERSLYLDADTRAYGPLADVFATLDRFDLALAHAHARNRRAVRQTWRMRVPDAFPQPNGGVIAFRRSPEVIALLEGWRDAYASAGFAKDQVTLRELLWISSLRIATLPPEYNLRRLAYLAFWQRREARPVLLHLRSFARDDWRAQLVDRIARTLVWGDRAPAGPSEAAAVAAAEDARA